MVSGTDSVGWQVRGGSVEEALANGHRLLDLNPAVALEQAEALLRTGPDARAFRLAAAAQRRLGETKNAEDAELAGIRASFRSQELERAALAHEEGDFWEAKAIAEDFLRSNPGDLLGLTIAADAAIELWELDTAEVAIRTVLDRAPAFLRASMLLAKVLMRQARLKEAISVLDEIIGRKPNNGDVLAHLAQLLVEAADIERAVVVDEKLLSLDDRNCDRWIHVAQHLRILGRTEEARNAFRQALAIDQGRGAAWWGLANYYPSTLNESDEEIIRKALVARAGSSDEAPLHLALGILADRQNAHSKAMSHFTAGKRLLLAAHPYDPERVTGEVDNSIAVYTPEFYAKRAAFGASETSPIFIVGMPRSGSTLVERVLGRHSAIEAAGELPILPRLAEQLRHQARNSGGVANLVASMSREELLDLGQRYLERATEFRRSDKPFFTDKLHLNWLHVGLIRLVLPRAKIIDVRRGALDCCWSNFKLLFAEGHPAANDLEHIGRFYRDYVRLMAGIGTAAPGGVLSVRYEDVVSDISAQTRRMLDFLELPFEADCIDFHLSTDAVATASSEQVRQPLYDRAVDSSKPYGPWLGTLREALGPIAKAYRQ